MQCISLVLLMIGVSLALPTPDLPLQVLDQLASPDDEVIIYRVRRSTQPMNNPPGPPPQQPSNGNVGIDVNRHPGGTHVRVDGERNLYRSRDGQTTVDAHGHYERTYNGPGASRPNYGGGVRVQHRW